MRTNISCSVLWLYHQAYVRKIFRDTKSGNFSFCDILFLRILTERNRVMPSCFYFV